MEVFCVVIILHESRNFISKLEEVRSNFTTVELMLGVRLWMYYSLLPWHEPQQKNILVSLCKSNYNKNTHFEKFC